MATKRSRTSAEQLSYLVDFMVENPSLAAGRFAKLHGKVEHTKKWSALTEALNKLGGCVKTEQQWQTVWRDLKSRSSIRFRERKKQQALTGNPPICQEPLTELDNKILSVIGRQYIEGHENVAENVPMEEELQIRMEEGDNIMFGDNVMVEAIKTDITPSTRTPSIRTPRVKRKRSTNENEVEMKFLDITSKQADAMKLLAESHTSNVQAMQLMADGLKCIGEGLKANAAAINNLTDAIKSFVSDK